MMQHALSKHKSEMPIYFAAMVLSLILSYWLNAKNVLINPDGICYLLSAQLLNTASIKDIMHYCPQAKWPLYSSMIYALAELTHLSYHTAANIINTVFSLISVCSFILIIKTLGASRRILWLAAFVILFNHQFNSVRDNIIRDHGFWAFYLLSIYSLLNYFREPHWFSAFAWSVTLLIATLFRVEGAIFLLALPFAAWFYAWPFKERAKAFFTLNLPLLCIFILAGTWFALHPSSSLDKLGRLSEIIQQVQNGALILFERYQHSKAMLAQYVLPAESMADVSVIIFFMCVGVYFYDLLATLSLGYALLFAYAVFNKVKQFPPAIWAYVLVNALITILFLAEHLFVSKRYLVALSLVLMLWVPFALDHLIQFWHKKPYRLFLLFVSLIIFINALGGLFEFGHSKLYLREAATWIEKNVPANAKLYANDIQLMYYTKHFGLDIFKAEPRDFPLETITQGKWKQYDYLALRINHWQGPVMNIIREAKPLKPIKTFNSKNHYVLIYKVPHEET